MGITLPKDVVDYIASHINTNVRELEGAFNKLVTFSHIKKEPITLSFAREALKDQIPIESGQELTVDFIIDTVCKYYGVKKEKLLGTAVPRESSFPGRLPCISAATSFMNPIPPSGTASSARTIPQSSMPAKG